LDGPRIAVVGATGAVGQVLLRVLEQRRFPASSIRLCASERSAGRRLSVNGDEITVETPTPDLLGEVDIVFISAGSDVSRELAPIAVERGATVVDKSAAFRMDPDVPLVVPEVNGDDIAQHRGIVSVPNCSTTPLVMALKPLHDVNPVVRVVADTYQSVSGTGQAAMEELRTQTPRVLNGQAPAPSAYPHQIAFNALPHIESFDENGYTREELKMLYETRKILHAPDLRVSATCVRVPVMVSHSEAVHVEFTHPISPDEVRDILSGFPGIAVVDGPEDAVYPMPVDAEGRDEVFVGRVRRDLSHPNGIAMWLVSDNLRKGAALNGVQIAEEMLSRGLLTASGAERVPQVAAAHD
jgi:aspartate-semialdehyde dehydrogenase